MQKHTSSLIGNSVIKPLDQLYLIEKDRVSMPTERLPFTVKIVRNAQDLNKAVAIRQSAYARHMPVFAEKLVLPEAVDFEEGVIVLLAESKVDGSPLGTIRIQNNLSKPLPLEQSVKLPDSFTGRVMGEPTRLGVTNDKVGSLVKTVLLKASFQYFLAHGFEYMMVAGRAPVDRQYDRLLFQDVFSSQDYVPLQHAGLVPHRILWMNVTHTERQWTDAKHPLLNFMFKTDHPDIMITENPMANVLLETGSVNQPVMAN